MAQTEKWQQKPKLTDWLTLCSNGSSQRTSPLFLLLQRQHLTPHQLNNTKPTSTKRNSTAGRLEERKDEVRSTTRQNPKLHITLHLIQHKYLYIDLAGLIFTHTLQLYNLTYSSYFLCVVMSVINKGLGVQLLEEFLPPFFSYHLSSHLNAAYEQIFLTLYNWYSWSIYGS